MSTSRLQMQQGRDECINVLVGVVKSEGRLHGALLAQC
jgi:hypothetical protein